MLDDPDDFKTTAPIVHGKCMGVDLVDRGKEDLHAVVTVYVEDDGNWNRKMSFSSYWIDELITVLYKAREELNGPDYEPDTSKHGTFGYRRKNNNGRM